MEKFKLSESLNSPRLVLLRREHEHDNDLWQTIDSNRSHLSEYLFWVDTQNSLSDVIKSTDMFLKQWDEDKSWSYNIYYTQNDNYRFVGCIAVHCISFLHQSAELGYWLSALETGHGYMTEAVETLTKALFAAGLHRIEICCDANNDASSRVAKRAGYILESVAKEAMYHKSGLHDKLIYVKLNNK